MATMKLNGAGTYAALGATDLSTKMHYLAKIGTTGLIDLADAAGPVIGTIFEPGTTTLPVTVQTNGNGKVICGATITAGQELEVASGGKATPLASGKRFGIALNSGLTNEIIEFTFKD